MYLTISKANVVLVQDKISKKGKAYKMAIVYVDGAPQTMQLFVGDKAPNIPVNSPVSMQLAGSVGFDGSLRFAIDENTKFKAAA